jgi:23S rRNA (cytosine1962-C5)-methyltransferase
MLKITLKSGRDEAVRRFHPWIFSGAIKTIEGDATDGALVEVYSSKDEWLAIGHFQQGSSITVRVISFEKTLSDLDFWKKKLQNAYNYRQCIHLADNEATDCYRLVHAEGDGLPGLIIDIYADTAVVQCHSIGMHLQRKLLAEALIAVFGTRLKAVYDKSRETLPENYAKRMTNSYLYGTGEDSENGKRCIENGNAFMINWVTGQKTGFFLDQRDNRQLITRYAKGKKVLNAFCYSGGFSIYALQAGAELVHSVDVSQKAIDLVNQNIEINGYGESNHEAFAEEVLPFLKNNETVYDIMVVDPPAFAKSIAKRHNAVQGYKRLNAAALSQIAPGGILFTFSCSQVVDKQLFYDTIVAAAIEAGRQVRVMHHLSQPADHPVSLFHPEGSYLKGLVVFVE